MHLTERERVIAQLTAAGQPYATEPVVVNGIEYVAFTNAPFNLRELYRSGLAHDGDFYVYKSERYSYEDAWREASKAARGLLERGIQKGDRVGIACRNYPEWAWAFMGITSMGGIAVAMNAWWSEPEMAFAIRDSGMRLLFADRERTERIAPRCHELGLEIVSIRNQKDGSESWTEFTSVASGPMPTADIEPSDGATLLYTSGSTAQPKGVLSTHRAVSNAVMGWEAAAAMDIELRQRLQSSADSATPAPQSAFETPQSPDPPAIILTVPLFHVTGLCVHLLSSFRTGRKVVGMYQWDVEEALRIIERERITTFNGVPIMSYELVQSPSRHRYDLSSLRSAGGGGAPMAPEQSKEINAVVGEDASATGWGMTETQGLATGIGGGALRLRPRSCGRALPPLVKVLALNDSGEELPPNTTGELCIWGVMNFSGYWNDPTATAEATTNGWVRSGDLGYVDEDGYVYITDRKKDMVLRAGENIGCLEVEAVLYAHPDIVEAAVFGVPHARLGESVAAVVVRAPQSSLSESAVRAFAKQHLAYFKVPDRIWIREERLPRTASEKIYKRVIREEALRQLSPGDP